MDSLIFEDTGDQAQASNSEENEPQVRVRGRVMPLISYFLTLTS
jgi:hypothetical protein